MHASTSAVGSVPRQPAEYGLSLKQVSMQAPWLPPVGGLAATGRARARKRSVALMRRLDILQLAFGFWEVRRM